MIKKVNISIYIVLIILMYSCGGASGGTDPVKTSIEGSLSYEDLIITYADGGTSSPTWIDALENQKVAYSIDPVNQGISINEMTGEITVSSTANAMEETSFTVTATGTGDYSGTAEATISITINARDLTGLSYNFLSIGTGIGGSQNPIWTEESPDATATFTMAPSAGGEMPAGITVGAETGIVTVSDTAVAMENTEFSITATGTGNYSGTITATITIRIATAIEGILSYTPNTFNIDYDTGGTANPNWDSPAEGQTVTYGIAPTVEGISVDAGTGVVTIDSTANVMEVTVFTITASGIGSFGGTKEATISITINPKVIQGTLTYNSLNVNYNVDNHTIVPNWVDNLPNQRVSYSIAPTSGGNVPEGIEIDAEGDIIVDQSTSAMENTEFTITVTGTGNYTGVITATVQITINPLPLQGTFNYNSPLVVGFGGNRSASPSWNSPTEGQTVTYSIQSTIDPDLTIPTELTIDSITGIITVNNPKTIMVSNYTIYAQGIGNYTGILSNTIEIQVEFSTKTFTVIDNQVVAGRAYNSLQTATDVKSMTIGDTDYVFIAARGENKIGVYTVTNNTLIEVDVITDTDIVLNNDDQPLNTPISIETGEAGGTNYVFVANFSSHTLSAMSVDSDGNIEYVSHTKDSADASLLNSMALTTAVIGGNTYLYTRVADSKISVFNVADNGILEHVQSFFDTDILSGDYFRISTETVQVGENTYLYTTGRNILSIFNVLNNGSITNIGRIDKNLTNSFESPNGLSTTTLGNDTYLFSAGEEDSGISVFRVGSTGSLTQIQDIFDRNVSYSLAYPRATVTGKIGDSTILFVGSQNTINAYIVDAMGILKRIETITNVFANDGTTPSTDALEFGIFNNQAHIIAVSSDANAVSVFRIGD